MIELPEDPSGRELVLMIERAKYERWLSQEIGDILSRTFNDVVDKILSPAFRSLSASERARTLQLARELDRVIQQGYSFARVTTLREMTSYATLERDVAAAQIQSMLTGSSDQLIAGVGANLTRSQLTAVAELPVQGLSISDWFEAQAAGMSRETRRLIQNGLLQGKSIPEMVRAIVPPKLSIEPALYRQARSNSFSIIRTTVNAVQNDAAVQSYRAAGNDISDSYRFVAVRDSRTTAVCRAADGKVFRNDDPTGLRPPLHIGCRSAVVPIVNDAFLSKREQRQQPLTFGSYDDWLKAQTASLQDTILGPARADYWRRGKMTLADAVDEDQRVLTLDQLRKRLGIEAVRQPAGAL